MYGIFTYTFSIEINHSWTGTYTSFMDPVTHMGVSLNGGTPNLHPKMINSFCF